MQPDEHAELALTSVRIGRCAAACLWLVALSSALFVQLSTRWLHLPLDSHTAAYVYPYWGAALLGVGLFAHDVVAQPAQRAGLGRRVLPLALFSMWIIASVSWGDSPYATPTEAMLIAGLLPGACWFGAGLALPEQLVALVVSMHTLIAASLLVVWASPEASIDLGNWIGVFANRNSLAPVAAIGALSLVGAWLLDNRRAFALPVAAVVLVDLYVLYRTGGDTSVLALAVALAVGATVVVVQLLRRWGVTGRVVASGAAVLGVAGWFAFFAFIGPITSAVGKDETLSNRRVVWQYLREVTADRRWKGFGYSSFWDDPNLVYPLYERTTAIFDSAHSTLMEIYVSTGLIGAGLLLAVVASSAITIARGAWDDPTRLAPIWPALFAFVVFQNLTESLIAYHSFLWAMVVSAAFVGRTASGSDRGGADEITGEIPVTVAETVS
jgi:O-antigen ligase